MLKNEKILAVEKILNVLKERSINVEVGKVGKNVAEAEKRKVAYDDALDELTYFKKDINVAVDSAQKELSAINDSDSVEKKENAQLKIDKALERKRRLTEKDLEITEFINCIIIKIK